jgi:hypothetical protein
MTPACRSLNGTQQWATVDYAADSPQEERARTLTILRSEDLLVEPEPLPVEPDGTQASLFINATTNLGVGHRDAVLQLPCLPPAREFFKALQKWEGYVLDVTEDSFRARLVTIEGEGPTQEVEIPLEELVQEDRKLVEPGAVFYWSIGYLDRPSGRLRTSLIRFRRLPAWSSRELEKARTEAEKLGALLGIEHSRKRAGAGRD